MNAVEGSIMEHDRPRWRFRLSTLMLLVIIGALALTLVLDRWKGSRTGGDSKRRGTKPLLPSGPQRGAKRVR